MFYDSDSTALPAAGKSRSLGQGISGLFLKRIIRGVEAGSITVVTPSGERVAYRADKPGPEAVLVLRSWRAVRRLIAGGDVGFAEAYIDGDWTSPDLTALIELAALNLARLDRFIAGVAPLRALNRLHHRLKANTRRGSRRNIAFHYDLGNDFYRLWLDPGMTYSSALYGSPEQSLEDAQAAKLRRIVELLAPDEGDRILEIGCGWGALAAHLAQQGAHVTGLTLSSEQLAHAHAALAAQGLGERTELRLQDYRDAKGSFDRIVSIEMLEAVGETYWPTYFQTLHDRLKPGGTAVLQIITIDENRFESYRRSPDFIQRYVFPGGMLPTQAILMEQAERAGLSLVSSETFGDSYALTLAEWRHRFLAAWPTVEKLGFGPSFRRLWDYYLCYCEAGFRTGTIDVGLYVLKR